jgi:hypothetical protein
LTPGISKIKPDFEINDVKFWKRPQSGVQYLVGVDPATGTGEDFTVITVWEFPAMEQVAMYRSNTMSSAKVYPILKNLLKFLERTGSQVYFSIENNGVGEGLLALYEADENPPLMSEMISETGKDRQGVTTTGKSKMRCCLNLKELIEKRTMTIKSELMLKELKKFVRRAAGYSAQNGATDDIISSTLIVLRILEEISSYDQAAFDTLRAVEDSPWSEADVIHYDEEDPDHGPMPFI